MVCKRNLSPSGHTGDFVAIFFVCTVLQAKIFVHAISVSFKITVIVFLPLTQDILILKDCIKSLEEFILSAG